MSNFLNITYTWRRCYSQYVFDIFFLHTNIRLYIEINILIYAIDFYCMYVYLKELIENIKVLTSHPGFDLHFTFTVKITFINIIGDNFIFWDFECDCWQGVKWIFECSEGRGKQFHPEHSDNSRKGTFLGSSDTTFPDVSCLGFNELSSI